MIGDRPPSAKLDLSPRLDCLGADLGAEPPDGHLQSPVTLTSTNLATVTMETRASNTMLKSYLNNDITKKSLKFVSRDLRTEDKALRVGPEKYYQS